MSGDGGKQKLTARRKQLTETGVWFNMLERELGGIRQSGRWVNTHLSRMEMLLRPLGRIADSLGRLTATVEHLVPATTLPPPPSARSIRRSTPALGCSWTLPWPVPWRSPACGPEEEDHQLKFLVSLVDSCSFRRWFIFFVITGWDLITESMDTWSL